MARVNDEGEEIFLTDENIEKTRLTADTPGEKLGFVRLEKILGKSFPISNHISTIEELDGEKGADKGVHTVHLEENHPVLGNNYFSLLVLPTDGDDAGVSQLAVVYNSSGTQLYIRMGDSGSWNEWKEVGGSGNYIEDTGVDGNTKIESPANLKLTAVDDIQLEPKGNLYIDAPEVLIKTQGNGDVRVVTDGTGKLTYNDNEVATKKDIEAIPDPMHYAGTWNASTNTPTLKATDTDKSGYVYRVTTAGTQFSLSFKVGDRLVYNEAGIAEKWDTTDEVWSVNGKTGDVKIDVPTVVQTTGQSKTAVMSQKAVTDEIKSIPTGSGVNKTDIALELTEGEEDTQYKAVNGANISKGQQQLTLDTNGTQHMFGISKGIQYAIIGTDNCCIIGREKNIGIDIANSSIPLLVAVGSTAYCLHFQPGVKYPLELFKVEPGEWSSAIQSGLIGVEDASQDYIKLNILITRRVDDDISTVTYLLEVLNKSVTEVSVSTDHISGDTPYANLRMSATKK